MPMSKRITTWTIVAALCLAAGGCLDDPLMELGAWDPLLEDCATTAFLGTKLLVKQEIKVDILVVVDNSMSMAEEQANLAENFPQLIRSVLDPEVDPWTGLAPHPVRDIHIGIISTDMGTAGYSVETCRDPVDGDDGILVTTPNPEYEGCDPAYPDYLSSSVVEPDEEQIEQLAHDFWCLAPLGIDGCGFEQPLKAAVRALGDREDGRNGGFLRRDSLLVIMFVTDEDDCSVGPGNERIYNTADSSLGHLNLRCHNHPYLLESVETYIHTFRTMRDDPERLLVSFVVGVPMVDACQGTGDGIPRCLEHPDMMDSVDPVPMTRLEPACVSEAGEAYPARRFVEIAQALGDNALVQSICDDDLSPAVSVLTDRLIQKIRNLKMRMVLPTDRDPEDPCRCQAPCRLVEMLSNDRPCPAAKPCIRSQGPRAGCRTEYRGGVFRSLCSVPQAGTITGRCGGECDDPDLVHVPDTSRGGGWYAIGRDWTLGIEEPDPDSVVGYTRGMRPEEGSGIYVYCEECLGEPTLTPVTGGSVGDRCSPETCPPLHDDLGEIVPGGCGWEAQHTYIAEAEECLGGACLVFRVQEGLWEPYCSRRCGRSYGDVGCPDGYACYLAAMHEGLVPGCYCVHEDQLNLLPGSADVERIWACL